MIKRPHCRLTRTAASILYNGPPSSPPLKIEPSHGRSGLPSNTWFLGYTPVLMQPNGISIGSAVLAGLTIVTDRPTDRPRYSVCNDRPHLASAAIRRHKSYGRVQLASNIGKRSRIAISFHLTQTSKKAIS